MLCYLFGKEEGAYRRELEMHELRPIVGVQQHPVGGQLFVLTGDLGEVQEFDAHGHVLHDGHNHLVV